MLFKSANVSEDELPQSGPSNIAKEPVVAESDATVETHEVEDVTVDSEDVLKVADLEAIVKAQKAELAAARDEIKKERDARIEREAFAKAEALPFVGETEVLAGVIKDTPDEVLEQLMPILEGLNERMRDNDLFKQFGNTDEEPADPITRRDVFVKEYRKDNPDATEASARAAFWQSNPELKDESREQV